MKDLYEIIINLGMLGIILVYIAIQLLINIFNSPELILLDDLLPPTGAGQGAAPFSGCCRQLTANSTAKADAIALTPKII